MRHRCRGRDEPDQPAAQIGDLDAALADARDSAKRLGKRAQLGHALLLLRRLLAQMNLDAIAVDGEARISDTRIMQGTPRLIEKGLGHFLAHRIGVDLQQEVRAAL